MSLCDLGLRLALVLLCTKFGEVGSNIFQILTENHLALHLSYVVAFNDLCDLENQVKVTRFKLGLHLILVLQCITFGEDMSNIS